MEQSGVRGAVERRSAPVLRWLSARQKVLLPALVVVLLVGGLAVPPPWSLLLLAGLGLLLLWLAYLSWPALDGRARALRVAMLALVVVALAQRVSG